MRLSKAQVKIIGLAVIGVVALVLIGLAGGW